MYERIKCRVGQGSRIQRFVFPFLVDKFNIDYLTVICVGSNLQYVAMLCNDTPIKMTCRRPNLVMPEPPERSFMSHHLMSLTALYRHSAATGILHEEVLSVDGKPSSAFYDTQ